MTLKQAIYQATRAARAEYDRVIYNPHSAGRRTDKIDSALSSAQMAFEDSLKRNGYQGVEIEISSSYGGQLDIKVIGHCGLARK